MVYHVVQSQLIEINHSAALWNTQAHVATELQSYNVVQLLSGISGEFLNGRTGNH